MKLPRSNATKARQKATAKALSQAHAALRAKETARAAALFDKVLAEDPACLDALYLLGTLRAEAGDFRAAEVLLEKAAALQPESPYIQTNLANVYLMQGCVERAAPALGRALALKPDLDEAEANLGILLRRLGRLDESQKHLQSVLDRRPDWPQVAINLSLTLVDLGRREEAVVVLRKALDRHPGFAPAQEMLGLQLGHLGLVEEAVRYLQTFVDHGGVEVAGSEAGLMLARLLGGEVPRRYPLPPMLLNYERKAASWDSDVERPGNEFLGPLHIRTWMAGQEYAAGSLRIADLGCGTGLCGPVLKPLARRLVGVDISRPMLDRARATGLYDELVDVDLVEFLRSRRADFDLAVASGVFILLGDLADPLSALRSALDVSGRAIFTAYRAERKDVEVRHNLHFAHHPDYIARVAAATGFAVESLVNCIHEYENGQAQAGLLVALRCR